MGLTDSVSLSQWMMSAPEKILFVIDHFKNPNAGTEGQLFQLLSHLGRQRFAPELLVFTLSPWLEQAMADNSFPCPVQVLGSRGLKNPKTWWRLWRHAKAFKASGGRLSHVFFNDPSLICPPVFCLAGLKTLISRRDMGYWYTPALKRILRLTGRCAVGAVANSQAVADITIESEGFKPEQLHVIYNGYEQQDYLVTAPEVKDSEATELKGLKARGRLLVGLVANIRPIKRIGDMVEALGIIKDSAPLLDFVHMGDGDTSELINRAKELGVEHRVHFLGPRTDVKACLQYLDLAALCSESEGFSNAIVEYLQAGLPVVCSAVGGNPEAVRNDFNGYLFETADIQALALVLEKLALSSELQGQMSDNARTEASERYTLESMLDGHHTLYSNLLNLHAVSSLYKSCHQAGDES